jgi:hypothetical protein
MSRLSVRLLLTALAVSSLLLNVVSLTAPAFADSQARVVRLSKVHGEVQVDRNTGRGLEKAFLNLPGWLVNCYLAHNSLGFPGFPSC